MLIDPKWFYITFVIVVVAVAGLMWWTGDYRAKK
jgi:hypothetical protein